MYKALLASLFIFSSAYAATCEASLGNNFTFNQAASLCRTFGSAVSVSLIPATDDLIDLGTSAKRFEDIFAAGLVSTANEFHAGDSATTNITGDDAGFIARRQGANAKMRIQAFGTNKQGFFAFDRANGTVASPTLPLSGDVFGSVLGIGYSSGFTIHSPEIMLRATENWVASTDYGSEIRIYTIPNDTASQLLMMTVGDAGGSNVNVKLGHLKLATASKGVLFTSPDGTCSLCTVDNSDVFSCTSNAC